MKKKHFIKIMIDLKMLITHHTDAIFCEKGMKHRVSDAVFGCCNPEAEKTKGVSKRKNLARQPLPSHEGEGQWWGL